MSAFGVFGNIATAGIQAVSNAITSEWNNIEAETRTLQALHANYNLNEQAANNADVRTRKLYYDLYSPEGQVAQLKAAGLSPSLFYGDGGGIAGQTGAQGSGAAGLQPQTFGVNPPNLQELALQNAQIENLNAQTEKTKSETTHQELENDIKELENTEFKTSWTIINAPLYKENGQSYSLYELAGDSYNYETFLKEVRQAAEKSDVHILTMTETEAGQATLRRIYEANNKFERDIAVLSQETVDANFYKAITQELKKQGYESLNAEQAVAQLRKEISQAVLDKAQKDAWNRILDRLGKKGSTGSDVAIVLGLILNNALTNWKLPTVKKGGTININYQK